MHLSRPVTGPLNCKAKLYRVRNRALKRPEPCMRKRVSTFLEGGAAVTPDPYSAKKLGDCETYKVLKYPRVSLSVCADFQYRSLTDPGRSRALVPAPVIPATEDEARKARGRTGPRVMPRTVLENANYQE